MSLYSISNPAATRPDRHKFSGDRDAMILRLYLKSQSSVADVTQHSPPS
ncbi:hypothetical protein H6F71_04755 [Microcoleus sp. FACHB-61]|nr:hypothetical protein [Microcoleus sp. FACHB-61]